MLNLIQSAHFTVLLQWNCYLGQDSNWTVEDTFCSAVDMYRSFPIEQTPAVFTLNAISVTTLTLAINGAETKRVEWIESRP